MGCTRISILIVVLALLPCGCRRSGESQAGAPANTAAGAPSAPEPAAPGQAPTGIIYSADPVVFTKGVPATPDIPYATGGPATSFRVNPALPQGLSLDPATGTISGTPAKASPAAAYQVTASNAAGSVARALTLTVNDPAPGSQPKITLPSTLTAGEPGQTASTQDLGPGTTYTWSLVNGTVDSGQGTASITFTTGGPGPLTAQVVVSNSGGSQSGRTEATVVAAPDATLTLPSWVRAGASGLPASVPAQAGMTYSWSIGPGTASATIATGQGSNQVTLTAGSVPGTCQLEVTVRNSAGRTATNRAVLTVR
jgi:hypothetical protein